MSEIRFSPQSWRDGAKRVQAAGDDFIPAAQAVLDSCSDIARMGASEGGTLADAALVMIMPVFHNAVADALSGLSENISNEATTMESSARNYEAVESANAELGALAGGQ